MAKKKEEITGALEEKDDSIKIERELTFKSAGAAGVNLWIEGVGRVVIPPEVLPAGYDTKSFEFKGICTLSFKFTEKK